MTNNRQPNHETLFRDKEGRIVIWQWPRIPLGGWIVFKVLAMLLSAGKMKMGTEQLAQAFLFLWAYLEITQGVNYFRRILGGAVLIMIVVGFFK